MDAWDRMSAGIKLIQQADSIASGATGLGVLGVDKSRDARPANPAWLSPQEAESASVVDAMLRRVVYGVPEDALAQGWRVDTAKRRDVTRQIDDDLELESVLEEVGATARLYGGCYSLMVIEGVQDYSRPLPPGPHNILQIHPMMALEATPLDWCRDIKTSAWTLPEVLQVQAIRVGNANVVVGPVHRSHLLYMPGLPKSRTLQMPLLLGYDISAIQAYWEPARDLGLAKRSAALALMEQSMVVLTSKGGASVLGGSQAEAALKALELWGETRSTRGTSLLTGDNTASRLEAPLTGLAEGVRVQYEAFAAVEGIPLTKLLGVAPGGISTDDAAGQRTYDAFISRYRRRRLEAWLRRLYRVALGDDVLAFDWPGVTPPTPQERAQRSLTLAQRDATLVSANILTPEECRARFAGDEELDMPVVINDANLDVDEDEEG